jgi:hypothetical protein
MKTGIALVSFAVVVLAVSGLLAFTTVKGSPAMTAKPLIDTRVPSELRTATFAMG